MTKIYCDSPIHKVSSLVLAFIILAFCVLPSFAHADSVRPNDPIGYKEGDTFRDILLVVLDSWGISFSKNDSSDSSTDILEFGDQLLQDFYRENETSQELFWDLVKYGVNEVGNLILDFTGVNAIRSVANWLIDKYNLVNNSTVDISDVSTGTFVQIPYYSGTDAPSVYERGLIYYTGINGNNVKVTTTYNSAPVFTLWYSSSMDAYGGGRMVFSTVPGAVVLLYNASYPTTVFTQTRVLSEHIGSFYVFDTGYGYGTHDNLANSAFPVFSSREEAVTALLNASSPVVINTDVISVPSDNDISPNDGLEIEIPGTNWGDSIYTILDLIERLIVLYDNTQLEIISIIDTLENLLENLQHSVSVENIPGAVTLDYDDYDIPIENEWGLFDIFFNTEGDEISLLRPWQELKSIIYGFPAPVLSFFALVVLFIVAYGFIRMGRDSH